jgi:NAD(P)-dependent dehydrogenase (short-subunit alcohol dehydrogenase family)
VKIDQWQRTIAITGAGSGFGAALAHHYAALGWRVAITDIDAERARQTLVSLPSPADGHLSMPLDVTNGEHWEQLEAVIRKQWGGLQILVNNAGVAAAGNVEETSIEDWQWVLDIDLMGVVRGCRQFAGMLKQQKSGHIVNIGSFAGLAALPFVSAYGVAKAGVVALSEALWAEMKPYGVGVTVACPAFVKTRLLDTFRSPHPETRDKVNRWMETSGVSAGQIAEEIELAVRKNRFLLLTHSKTKTAWRMKRWFPGYYYRMISRVSGG